METKRQGIGRGGCALVAVGLVLGCAAGGWAQDAGQQKSVPKAVPIPVPVPALPGHRGPVPDPATPPAQTVVDEKTHVTFRLPPGWNVSKKDGEVSTFHLDAESAPRRAELRVVASLAFNPYPYSTFSGALFYLSVTPNTSEAACGWQTSVKPEKALEPAMVGGVKFSRGKDEHGHICTEARDVTYTAVREGSCVRFDLAVNTFCGGDDSGVADMTDAELGATFKRLQGVLETVEFGK